MSNHEDDWFAPDTIVVPLTPELRMKLSWLDSLHQFCDETYGSYGSSLSTEMEIGNITESLGEALYDAYRGRKLIT